MKLYTYLRYSTAEQSKGTSTARQRALLEAFATKHGLVVDDSLAFSDEGVSAFRGKNVTEGGLGRFLSMMHAGEIERGSYLTLENLDRLTRMDPQDALSLLMEITRRGIVLVTLAPERVISRETLKAGPWALYEILGSMHRAHEESTRKSELISGAWKARRNAVMAGTSTRKLTARGPAWLTLSQDGTRWTVNKERARIVEQIYKWYASGLGFRAIARRLNERGVKPFGGGRPAKQTGWAETSLRKLLDSIAPVGDFQPHRVTWAEAVLADGTTVPKKVIQDLEIAKGYFPAIVSEDLNAKVKTMRQSSGGARAGKAAHPVANYLAGLAVCPVCGGGVSRFSSRSGSGVESHWYKCRNAFKAGKAFCTNRSRLNAEDVQARLRQSAPDIVEQVPTSVDLTSEIAQAESRVAGIEAGIDHATDAILQSPASVALRDKLAKLEARLPKARDEVSTLYARQTAGAGKLVEGRVWDLFTALTAPAVDPGAVNVAMRGVFGRVEVDGKLGTLTLRWAHMPEEAVTVEVYPFGRP